PCAGPGIRAGMGPRPLRWRCPGDLSYRWRYFARGGIDDVLRGAAALGAEGEGHRSVADDSAANPRRATENAHPAAEPLDDGFDLDGVARVGGPTIADPLDTHEERQLLAILRLGEDQDRSDLRNGLGEDR